MNSENGYSELLRKAEEVRKNAYAPYSGFYVGACILTDTGNTYVGANFENSAFGAGTCAERCAIASAVAAGDRHIKAVAVVANYAAWPCGICRQAIREFCVSVKIPVIIRGVDDTEYRVKTLEELLPESFGPDALDDIK